MDAYKRAISNLSYKPAHDNEAQGTLVELFKQTMSRLETSLFEKLRLQNQNSELSKLEAAVDKVKQKHFSDDDTQKKN